MSVAQEENQLEAFEKVVIALASLLFLSSAALFFSDIPLRQYILGWQDEATAEKVGVLQMSLGETRRKTASGSGFQIVSQKTELYNFDTVITDEKGSATISLDDGGKIELGPKTMVKLVFASRLSLAGISRSAKVDVVSGEVKGTSVKRKIVLKSKNKTIEIDKKEQVIQVAAPIVQTEVPGLSIPPEIPTTEVLVATLTPKTGTRFKLSKGSRTVRRRVTMKWKVDPPDTPVRVTLFRTESADNAFDQEVLLSKEMPGNSRSVTSELDTPGSYEWRIDPLGENVKMGKRSRPRARFKLDPRFEGISVLPPLVGGQAQTSNEYSGKSIDKFDITLRWERLPAASDYLVEIFKNKRSRTPVFQRKVAENSYTINREKVFTGRLYYRISAELENGFLALSKRTPFSFDFLPPRLVSPVNGSTISGDSLKSGNDKILFTWQKTNFTEHYEIEISNSKKFSKVLLRRRVNENFYVLKTPKPGQFFWRVRSFSKGVYSPHTAPFGLSVKR